MRTCLDDTRPRELQNEGLVQQLQLPLFGALLRTQRHGHKRWVAAVAGELVMRMGLMLHAFSGWLNACALCKGRQSSWL